MPEMPEVETVVRSLRKHLVGRRIRRVEVRDEKLGGFDLQATAGRTIRGVLRSGKEIVLDVSTLRKPLWLCVHLRMTGKLIYLEPKAPLDERHLRALFRLNRGTLCFYDARRFGRIRLASHPNEFAPPGVEILSDEFTAAKLKQLIANTRTPIKTWLLRQDRVVGFGNIYAAEVCHAAGIDPRRPAGLLADAEVGKLHRHTRRIFAKAIEAGGTTIFDFIDGDGRSGTYRRFLKVYGRAGKRCRRRGCEGVIKRIVQAGRGTFYCPTCQK